MKAAATSETAKARAARAGLASCLAGAAVLLAAPAAPAGTPSPADWRDQTIYQLLTDRFFDADPANNTVEGFYDPADGARNHGGDWQGVEAKLDYIQGMGATAIWISPAQTTAFAAYHGYHIRDFYSFAAHFGGLAALQSLVDAAHARGMYVILDVIANHGGDLIDSADPGYAAFQNPGTYTLRWRNPSDRHAPPFDNLAYFHNNGAIGNYVDPEQILGELAGLDDFRTEDPTVRQHLIDAHTWLIDQTDADGFRIDTVKHTETSFWQDFGPQIRQFAADSLGKNNFLQFGEIFDGDPAKNGSYTGTEAGGPYALDSVLWYPMHFTLLSVFRDGAPTRSLSNVLADSVHYDPSSRSRLIHFLDNHDVGRFQGFQSGADRDDAKAKLALVWNHTSLGVPLVYYGNEQEFDGGSDPWNREDMWDGQWDFGPSVGDNFDMTSPLYRAVRRLNDLREQFPALRRGAIAEVASDPGGAGLFAYTRTLAGEENVFVLLNTEAAAHTLTVDPDLPAGTVWDGLTGRSFVVPASGAMDITVGGLSAVVLTATEPDPRPWVLKTFPSHDGTLAALDAEVRITFTEPMSRPSVEAAVTVTPAAAHTVSWAGPTMILSPTAGWASATTYTVAVGGAAQALDGGTLDTEFSFFFRTDTTPGPATPPAGWAAYSLAGDDLQIPTSLEGGRGLTDRQLLLGDRGWDRVQLWDDRGFVESRFADAAITRPSGLAQDAPGGLFGGDLLIADRSVLLRARLDGADGGAVETLAPLPATANNWTVAVDPSGAFGGQAFVGRAGSGTVYSVDAAGSLTPFATGLGGVAGLAFGNGTGGFGTDLFVLSGSGTLWRVDPAGTPTSFVASSQLSGAEGLAIDAVGSFGGHAYTGNGSVGGLVQVTGAAAVSVFATGFSSFSGPDAIAFDALGDLHALADVGAGTTVVKVVPNSTAVVVTETPVPLAAGILSVGPNPFGARSRVEFAVPAEGGTVRLAVHDVTGREVAVLEDARRPGGRYAAEWDGRDAAGHAQASGVYFVKLRVAGREYTRKLVLLR